MAVIKELPGLEATIQVNGQDLQEYDSPYIEIPDDDEPELLVVATKESPSITIDVTKFPHVIKYIEAVPGAEFNFNFIKRTSFEGRCNHIAVGFRFDTQNAEVCHEPREKRRQEWIERRGGICWSTDSGTWLMKNYRFEGLQRVDSGETNSDTADDDIITGKQLGILRISAFKMKYSEPEEDVKRSEPKMKHDGTITEKALKGRNVDASVQYGPARATPCPAPWPKNVFQDPHKRPFAIFEFRYMTRDGLIQEGILPKPTPIDIMNDQEARDYARKLHNEREAWVARSVKTENIKKEEDDPISGSLKRSASTDWPRPLPKRFKETHRDDGNVEVDLTD